VFLLPLIATRHASKRAGKKSRTSYESSTTDSNDPGSVPLLYTKGKGGKGKSRTVEADTIGDLSLPGESFNLSTLESNMERSIERLRTQLYTVVAQVGTVSPEILEPVRVEIDGVKAKLSDYANVSVMDGSRLKVNIYDPSVRPLSDCLTE